MSVASSFFAPSLRAICKSPTRLRIARLFSCSHRRKFSNAFIRSRRTGASTHFGQESGRIGPMFENLEKEAISKSSSFRTRVVQFLGRGTAFVLRWPLPQFPM